MVRRWQQVSLEEAKQHPLYGIKNWLAVFAFAVLLIPLREFGGLRGAAYDAGMTLTQFLSYNEAFGTYAKIVLALETLMAAVIFWLLFTKQRSFRVVTSSLLLAHWPVISLFALATKAPGVGGVIGLGLISWVLSCTVWVTYLQRSRRVRVTFENCVVVAKAHPELTRAQPMPTTSRTNTAAAPISDAGELTRPFQPVNVASAGALASPVEVSLIVKLGPWIFGVVCLVALLFNIFLKKDSAVGRPGTVVASASEPVSHSPARTDAEKLDSPLKAASDMSQQEAAWQVEIAALMETGKAEGLDYAQDTELNTELNGLVKAFGEEAAKRGMSDVGLVASKWALQQAHDVMRQRHAEKLFETIADLKAAVHSVVGAAMPDEGSPIPKFRDAGSRLNYLRWAGRVSKKLEKKIPDYQIRQDFIQTVWYESKRAGLDAALVLGVIESLSDFRKYYVSVNGARGYMAVNPGWYKRLGDGDASKLFHMQTNLRFGCVVLRHYLDQRKGDTNKALLDYAADSFAIIREDPQVVQLAKRVVKDSGHWKPF